MMSQTNLRSSVPASTKGNETMTSPLREGQRPPQSVLKIIVRYFNKVARPVYLGTLSLEVGWSLARTHELVEQLVDEGVIRAVTDEEKAADKIPTIANLYVLIGEPTLSKAWS